MNSASTEPSYPASSKSSMAVVEVCLNQRATGRPSCMATGSRELLKALKSKGIQAKPTTCLGHCHRAVACRIVVEGQEPEILVEADVERVMEALEK